MVRLQGWCWVWPFPQIHMTQSVLDYFPNLSSMEPLVVKQVGLELLKAGIVVLLDLS